MKFVEVTNNTGGGINWGKFAVCEFTPEEWAYRSHVGNTRLLAGEGWGANHRLVLDLATGEGAVFRLGGSATVDLEKHRVWVCVLFEPFLTWLYERPQPIDIDSLPEVVELPNAPSALYGYRRPGPKEQDDHPTQRVRADADDRDAAGVPGREDGTVHSFDRAS